MLLESGIKGIANHQEAEEENVDKKKIDTKQKEKKIE